MFVSVVVLTSNRRLQLEMCLAALGRQTRHPDEVVVLDMASTDGTPMFLADIRTDFPIRTFRIDLVGGFAEARNAAVERAKGDVIAFIDDDCEADMYWLERLVARLDNWSAVGGAVLPADALPAPDDFSPSMAWMVGLSPPEFYGPRGGKDVLPQTASLAFKRKVLERHPFQNIGGRLGQGTGNYAVGREDAEWWRRIRRAGEPCGVEARAIVWHHIEADRFATDTVLERAGHDGAAFWRREKPRHMVRAAVADIVSVPAHIMARTLEPRYSDTQAWGEALAWATRQTSFLRAGVDDRSAGVAPTERAAAYVRESARMLAGMAKGAVRPCVAAAYHAIMPDSGSPIIEEKPERLLFVLHPFLGDAVLALPLLKQLAQGLSGTELVLLSGAVNHELLADQLPEWNVRQVPASCVGKSPKAAAALHRFVAGISPDVIVAAYAHGLNPIGLFAHRGATTVGWTHDNGMHQRLWGQLMKIPVEKRWDQHESVALLNLAAPFGIATKPEHPTIVPGDRAKDRVAEVLKRFGIRPNSYIALHVEKDTNPKYWFEDGFAALAGLLEQSDHRVALIGSKSGRAAADAVRRVLPSAVAMHGSLDSAELAAFLSQALAFVGADSGPQHVAAAVGCPSLVLFGPTDERRWGPIPTIDGSGQDTRRIVRASPVDWEPEILEVVGEGAQMKRIGHEHVFSELEALLAAWPVIT